MRSNNLGFLTESGKPELQPIRFEAYGVGIEIGCNNSLILREIESRLPRIIPKETKHLKAKKFDHLFFIKEIPTDNLFEIYKNSKKIEWWTDKNALLDYLDSQLRVTIAEYAVSRVFIHAGVVSWKGNALVIPGKSYSGKTTLTAELIKRGAIYYSDEYAVIDERGYVHPFPKMLSIRGIIDEFTQVDFKPEDLGGKIGTEPLPVKLVLITEFEKNAVWKPSRLKTGEGIIDILRHTLPTRLKPAFTLRVISKMAKHAVITKSKRGEVGKFAQDLIHYMETVST